jgi:hypothetical protein
MSWFEEITGFPETGYEETRDRLRVEDGALINERDGTQHPVGTLDLPMLGELRDRTARIRLPGQLKLSTVRTGAGALHADPDNRDAIVQVASQFNLLEMIGPGISPEDGVTRYAYDRTQGPACAIAAGAGTIWRNYLVPVRGRTGQTEEVQINTLTDLEAALSRDMGVAQGDLWRMRNGYALPEAEMLERIGAHLSGLDEAGRDRLRGLLRVGVHRDVGVTRADAPERMRVTQVYCSAMPVAYSNTPQAVWAPLARLILEAAYEATLLVGLLNAGGSRRVLLTRLGGGAFGNDRDWIDAALLRALRLLEDQGLEVLMVSPSGPTPETRRVEAAWDMILDDPDGT